MLKKYSFEEAINIQTQLNNWIIENLLLKLPKNDNDNYNNMILTLTPNHHRELFLQIKNK